MMRLLPMLCLLGMLLATALEGRAQIIEFSLGGGSLTLTINTAVAGQEPSEVTDNLTEIHWDADFGVTAKMSVSTVCPGQSFSLYVELEVTSWGSGTQGTEQPEAQLTDGMMATDVLRDIPSTAPGREGYGTLTYRATATVAQGTSAEHGDDVHTITYTILEQ